MPRDYTFKEWVKLKKGHLDISKSVKKDLFRLWVIDKSIEALDPDEDPFGKYLNKYNWVFPKEIEQLADEYEIKIREKGQGIKSLREDGDNLKDFRQISIEAMLREFLVLILLFPFDFISLMYNMDIVQIKWEDRSRINT
ncbi:hypothetical protein Tco_1176820 [Tanacetum coccineum]